MHRPLLVWLSMAFSISNLGFAAGTGVAKESRRVFYISFSQGSDQNDGLSEKTPFKTAEMISQWSKKKGFQPGDQILFKRGDIWNEKVLLLGSNSKSTEADPILIKSYGDGPAPIFDGKIIQVEGLPKILGKPYQTEGFIILQFKHLRISDLHFRNVGTAINVDYSEDVHLKNLKVENTFSIGLQSRNQSKRILIENNDLENLGNDAIYLRHSEDCVVRGNTIRNILTDILGYKTAGDKSAIGLEKSKRSLVENNRIYNSVKGGIDFYYEEDSEVRNNYLYHTSHFGSPHGTGLKIHHNTFYADPSHPTTGINAVVTGDRPIEINENIFYGITEYGLRSKEAPGKGQVSFHGNIVQSKGKAAKLVSYWGSVQSDKNCFISSPGSMWYFGTRFTPELKTFSEVTGLEKESTVFDPGWSESNLKEAKDFILKKGSLCASSGAHL